MRFEIRLIEFLKTELSQGMAKPDVFGAAIKTARSSSVKIRLKLISDMAAVLGCMDEDLMFLFDDMPYNDNDVQIALPSFRESIALEAAE